MKKKLMLPLLGLLSIAAMAADRANIYEIRPWHSDGLQGCVTNYDYSAENPLTGGEKLWFVIRVIDSNWSTSGSTSLTNWSWPRYLSTDMQNESAAWAAAAPKIGIVVSGRTVGATIENIGPDEFLNSKSSASSQYYTDIICSYTVQPGDFALPIRLAADGNGTPIDGKDTTGNHKPFIINGNLWRWCTEGTGSGPELIWEWADFSSFEYMGYRTTPEGVARTSDYDLFGAGFYAKTIDFTNRANEDGQPRWYAAGTSWRGVREGSTEVEPSFATLTLTGVSPEKTTLYVWSEDDEIIRMASGTPVTMRSKDGSGTIRRTVYTVEFAAGEMTKTLPLEAVAPEGRSTSLVLSEFKGFRTLGSGGNIPDEDYLTIPVSVIERPQPTVKVTVAATDTFDVPANPDGWKTPVGTVKLTISGGYQTMADSLTVTLTPSLVGGSADACSNYVRIARNDVNYENTSPIVFSYDKNPTSSNYNGSFADGADITETVYVFGLGADSLTSGEGVKITPTIDGAAEASGFFKDLVSLNIRLNPEEPAVSVTKVETSGNFKRKFVIKVTDNHKNTIDDDGYAVSYWYTNTVTGAVSDSRELDGKWKLDGNYTLVSVDDATKRPEVNFTPGRYVVVFQVTTPAGDVLSSTGSTNVNIAEPARVSAFIELDDGTTTETGKYNESDDSAISVKVTISEGYPGELWAFLAPVEDSGTAERSGGNIVTNAANSAGMKIIAGELNSEVGRLYLIDGKGGAGSTLSYDVLLCTTKQFDPTNVVERYQSKTLTLTASNLAPVISDVLLNGFQMNDYENRHFLQPIPSGRANVIKPEIEDVMADVKGDMIITLNATSDSGDIITPMIVTNTTETVTAEFRDVVFTTEGKWTVKIKATDKDGGKSNEYVFTFNVREPGITIGSATRYFEEYSENASSAELPLTLSFFDPAATGDIVVKVTVTPPSGSNPGRFVLHESYKKDIAGYDPLGENEYYVPFKVARTENMRIEEMDGTARSGGAGFTVKAEVATPGLAVQYPTVSKKVYVKNVAPQFSSAVVPQNTMTNAFPVGRVLSWSVDTQREVMADLTNSWVATGLTGEKYTTNGVRVAVSGCANADVFFMTDPSSYTFKPEFDNSSVGVQTVMLMIQDKDGDSGEPLVYYYEVPLSKTLVTVANGPGSGTANIELSTRYARQKGVGEGHVYVSGASFEKAENFALKWNCGLLPSVTAYAFGYSTDAIDDGTLNVVDGMPYDVSINTYGNRPQGSENPAEPYRYADNRMDSYFYGWIQSTEAGGKEYVVAVSPDVGGKKHSTARIDLPTEPNKDGAGYVEAYAEAVFSKEYKESDNMGDINADGVPDYFAILDYANGRLAVPDGQGGELGAVNSVNDDGDFLPGNSQLSGATFIPGETSGWSTRSAPFTARMEIRGFGGADESDGNNSTVYGGLNYGMFKFGDELKNGWVSDLDLTRNEKISLLNHVFARRDAILNRRYTQRPGVNKFDGGDWNAVTNVLATLIRSDTSYYENGAGARKAYVPGFEDKVPSKADGSPEDPAITMDGWNEGLGHKTFVIVTNVVNAVASQPELYPAMTNITTNVCWVSEMYSTSGHVPRAITNTVEIVTNIYTVGTTVTTNLFWRTPYDRITLADVNVGEWLDRKASESAFYESQAAARAYIDHIWGHYLNRDTSEWGWTCENRTDPTVDDTDGDGFSDGYEYYIWYSAVVGINGNTLTGYKLDTSDRDSRGIPITSSEIASLYNPNVEGSIRRDTDGDGIADYEEMVIGTNPFNWDTDADGLSDGYELTYNMDPLSASGEHGCDMNLDGDFMAFVDVADNNSREEFANLIEYKYVYTATNGTLWAFSTNVVDEIRYLSQLTPAVNVFELTNVVAFRVGKYGVTKYTDKESVTKYYDDYYIPGTEDLDKLLKFIDPESTSYELDSAWTNAVSFAINPRAGSVTLRTEKRNSGDPEPPAVALGLFHHQVHNALGFDPRTGWYSSANGLSKTARWKNNSGSVVPGGAPQNTVAFTAKYEYNLPKYLSIVRSNIAWTPTNPSIPYEASSESEDGEVSHYMTQHGADTDADGVPDGWELYIGVDPGMSFESGDETNYGLIKDIDKEDGLLLNYEFAGTDSCGVYSECASIYKYHPSQDEGTMKNWYNKFFPTNPRSSDSDGDSILDGTEGKNWKGEFVINRIPQTEEGSVSINYYSIYGYPSDDGTTSIRGGGYNPCTIDTDSDGLPDPWERQFSGVLFNGTEIADSEEYEVFYASAAGQIDQDVRKDIRTALLAYDIPTNVLAGAEFYHILMGMDGTVADASTSTLIGSSDLDWDGDGLQNWQEYMVQAMRLFRYDDDRTPLLGRDCPSVRSGNRASETPGSWNGDKGFLKVSYSEPFTDVQLDFIEQELGYSNFAQWARSVKENKVNYLGDLGYFVDPPMVWDHARNTLKQKYMLPPANIRYYTFAKGLSQATDGDGNAIYTYELAGKQYEFTNNVSGVVTANGRGLVGGRLRVLTPKMVDNSALAMDAYTVSPGKYFSTDPRRWDTDADGMDDYYELFHGLNPILGEVTREAGMHGTYSRGKDVIATATDGKVSPGNNAWIGWSNEEAPVYDPIRYPWLMGAGECDADSDGLRNTDESLAANLTSPNAMHTDPTPLWMTDVSVKTRTSNIFRTTTEPVMEDNGYGEFVQLWDYDPKTGEEYPVYVTETVDTDETVELVDTPSYAALFYGNELRGTGINNTSAMSALPYGGWHLSSSDYAFSFEQNEGYDTDNDWRSDSAELQNSAEPTSDPLDFADPQRRQSVWFGGPDEPGMLVSREESERKTAGADLFKQFTVEAWVRPEITVSENEQYVVSRAVYCNASSVINPDACVRLDFALGIDSNGCAFGELMNSVDISYRQTGPMLSPNEWTHLAATFDGYGFTLYVNGEPVDSGITTLIPANGTMSILQNPHFTRMEGGAYRQDPSIMAIGARPVGETIFNVANVTSATGWSDIATDFFKGSVDEVRCWDGARTADEIKADYRSRYTPERAKENRVAVYNAYVEGASRNDATGRSILPPELIHHYDFSTLAGAHEAAYVQKVPAGFGSRLLASARRPDTDERIDDLLKVGWWSGVVGNADIGSKVYTSPNVVPWVEDTVAHLPKLCGSVADSVFWSENFAGYVSASDNGLSTYSFPNSMNPYTVVENLSEYAYLRSKLAKVSNTTNETANAYPELSLMTEGTIFGRFYYDNRRGFSGNSDLIPLGSAFAKRLTMNWDGIGPDDAWAATTTGADDDDNIVNVNINPIPEWARALGYEDGEKYRAALEDGLLPDGSFNQGYTVYATDNDTNGNGMADWWERHFGIFGCEADEDLDNDGLSNYQEYLISFGDYSTLTVTNAEWRLNAGQCRNKGMPVLDPTNPRSTGDAVTDYFLKPDFSQLAGVSHITENTYLGEMATDHDFMEMWWERENGLRDSNLTAYYSNPFVYDPHLDLDGDGWSNFAEARAYSWHGGFIADLIDSYLLKRDEDHILHYPQPAIGVNVTYNGKGDYTSKTLVVRARTKADGRVDATLVAEGYEQTNSSNDGGEGSQLIGLYPGATTLHGFMNPGYIIPSTSVAFDFRPVVSETLYHWHCTECSASGVTLYAPYNAHVLLHEKGNEETGELGVVLDSTSVGNDYQRFAHSEPLANARTGRVLLESANTTNKVYIGTINYITGEYSLDLAKAAENGCDLKDTVLRVSWTFQRGQIWPQTVWLSQPVSTYATGLVKEGKNIIEAFIDLNLNNLWDEGEPYGMVKDVEIGWHKTGEAIDIELRDESPIMKRTPVTFGSTGDSQSSFTTAKVAVRRTAINGVSDGLPVRTLCSTTAISDDRAYITEADVITAARPDLDWAWLARDAERNSMTVNNATYEVVRIDTFDDGTKSNVVLSTFTREFHLKPAVPTALAPVQSGLVYAARPTFTFASDDDTMAAYRLQVATSESQDDVIWDSGTVMLPGRISYTIENGATYRVSPELYVDTFATTNSTPCLLDGSNYVWRVALLNSKFNKVDPNDSTRWSPWSVFMMDVRNKNPNPDVQTGYGNAAAAVRYYGAGTVTDTAAGTTNIIVEAYASADFTGIPLARMRVENLDLLSSATDVTTTNVVLRGLPPGETFLVAFVDSNNNCRRDKFESWGYANYVGEDTKFIYKPKAVEVTNIPSQFPSISIFIEDTDINQNELVDILEFSAISIDEEISDTDGDGLKDAEEDNYAADAAMWDTDGDGMPDGWEALYAKLDPTLPDADYVADDDVMAYAVMNMTIITTWDGEDEDSATNTYAMAAGDASVKVGDDASAIDGLCNVYEYGYRYGLGLPASAVGSVYAVRENAEVVLVHGQVYDAFGFNPNTANGSLPAESRVNTKPFSALDKYLVVRYLEALGLADEADVNRTANWKGYTLKPGDADCDHDGMPDGWELYVMSGPAGASSASTISPWIFDDRAGDPDGDDLENVDEWSIGEMPTDPWDADTDKDGINDRASYEYMFKYGGSGDGKTGYRGDADNDQLSNFMEYLISGLDGFPATDPEADLDPSSMRTFADANGQLVPDYFLPQGKLYLGEMFTDHDMIEDWWEDEQPVEVTVGGVRTANYSRYSYDASRDTDGNGWSNWAEARLAIEGRNSRTVLAGATTNFLALTTYGNRAKLNQEYADLLNKYGEDNILDYWGEYWGDVETGYGEYHYTVRVIEDRYETETFKLHPAVSAALSYNGENLSADDTIVIKAWSADSSTVGDPDAVWTMTAGDLKTAGFLQVALEAPDAGELREGENTFVAYVTDGTSTGYAVGKPYGSVKGVRVSYLKGTPFSIELTDVDPTSMRINISDAITVQRKLAVELAAEDSDFWSRVMTVGSEAWFEYYGMLGSNYNEVVESCVDRGMIESNWATCSRSAQYAGTNLTFTASDTVHIWITQMLLNGAKASNGAYYREIAKIGPVNLDRHPVLTEADMVSGQWFDLGGYVDENGVATSTIGNSWIAGGQRNIGSLTNASFAIILEKSPATYRNENNILIAQMVNHYDYGLKQSDTTDKTFVATGSQPTFMWKHASAIGKPYPAFQLKIWDADGTLVFDSGVQRSPARGRDGFYSWTAPIWAGSLTPQGEVFESDKEYIWDVSMLDAKFVGFNGSISNGASVRISSTADLSDYGQIAVGVKYMGPGTVNVEGAKGIIRVEAYSSPDFSGLPVAAGYVRNVETIGDIDKISLNALVIGLPKGGEYYMLAYLDSNGDGVRQPYESWGYGCHVGDPDRRDVYTPREYGVSLTEADDLKTTTCVIYIEDCDTNGNKLPDTLELNAAGEFSPVDVEAAASPYIVTVDDDGNILAENIYKSIEADVVNLPYYSMLMEFKDDGRLATPSLALAMAGLTAEELSALKPEPKVVITAFSPTEGIAIKVDPSATVDGRTLEPGPYHITVNLKFTFEWTPNLATPWTDLVSITEPLDIREMQTFAADDEALKDTVNKAITDIYAEYPKAFFRLKSVEVVND